MARRDYNASTYGRGDAPWSQLPVKSLLSLTIFKSPCILHISHVHEIFCANALFLARFENRFMALKAFDTHFLIHPRGTAVKMHCLFETDREF